MQQNTLFDLEALTTPQKPKPKPVMYYAYVETEEGRYVAAQPKPDHWSPQRGFYLNEEPNRKPRLWKRQKDVRVFIALYCKSDHNWQVGKWEVQS